MNKNVITGIVTCGFLLVGGATIHEMTSNHNQVAADRATVQSTNKQVDKYNRMKKDLTQADVAKNLSHSKNMDAIKGDATKRINDSFNTAYSNMTSDKYDGDRKNFETALGKSAGDKLASVAQPLEKTYSQSVNNMKVGFGKYNEINETIPVVVVVNFKANDSTTLTDKWTLTYHADSHQFSNASQMTVPNNINNGNDNNQNQK